MIDISKQLWMSYCKNELSVVQYTAKENTTTAAFTFTLKKRHHAILVLKIEKRKNYMHCYFKKKKLCFSFRSFHLLSVFVSESFAVTSSHERKKRSRALSISDRSGSLLTDAENSDSSGSGREATNYYHHTGVKSIAAAKGKN